MMEELKNEHEVAQNQEAPEAVVESVPEEVQEKVQARDASEAESSEETKVETRPVMMHPIPSQLHGNFEQLVQDLYGIFNEIQAKQEQAHEQNKVIGERIDHLVKTYGVEINRSHYEHFVTSIMTYMQLLHDIQLEFAREIGLCRYVAELKEPTLYDMPVNVELDAYKWFIGHDALTDAEKHALVMGKIQQVKRHIKTVKKDLRVSFSRYLFGFDAQMKQVERIELSMYHLEQRKKHHQMHAKKEEQPSSETTQDLSLEEKGSTAEHSL